MKLKNTLTLSAAILTLASSITLAEVPRHFPAPSTVSPQMAQSINQKAPRLWVSQAEDTAHLLAIKQEAAQSGAKYALALAEKLGVKIDESVISGITVRTLTPPVIDQDKQDKIVYYIHGGGYVFGDGLSGTPEGILMASLNHYKVIAVDYRMAPEDPYPAAIDDAFIVYRELQNRYGADNIAVMGTSTGGAMTLILALQALNAGVPLPAALISGTPWSDIDKIGDSYVTNDGVDNILGTYEGMIRTAAEVYTNGADLKDPLISPVYAGEDQLAKFPPTLLVTGTRDLFLSNTARMHIKLCMSGADAELLVYEALSHAQYYLNPSAPETANHYELLDLFLKKHWL